MVSSCFQHIQSKTSLACIPVCCIYTQGVIWQYNTSYSFTTSSHTQPGILVDQVVQKTFPELSLIMFLQEYTGTSLPNIANSLKLRCITYYMAYHPYLLHSMFPMWRTLNPALLLVCFCSFRKSSLANKQLMQEGFQKYCYFTNSLLH